MSEIKYVFFSTARESWLEFIPLKKTDQDGEEIIDLNYDKLPDLIYGKIKLGVIFGDPVYMFRTLDKDSIQLTTNV